MELDEHNATIWNIYALVRNQVRLSSMGDLIDLDHTAVLGDIGLYFAAGKVKETFEDVLECFSIEREFVK